MSEVHTPSTQPPIAFQSKFAARKAQEDRSFIGLYSGTGFQNQDVKASQDLKQSSYNQIGQFTNQSTLTRDGSWDKQQRLAGSSTATNNNIPPHKSNTNWTHSNTGFGGTSLPNYDPQKTGSSSYTAPEAPQYVPNSNYAQRKLVGSSSNSAFSYNRPVGIIGQESKSNLDYRSTIQNPPVASHSLNYDDKSSQNTQSQLDRQYQPSQAARFGAITYDPIKEPSSAVLSYNNRGKSSDAVDSRQPGYKFGSDTLNNRQISHPESASKLSNHRLNGNATYDLNNIGRQDRVPVGGFNNEFDNNVSGPKNQSSFERLPGNVNNQGNYRHELTSSVGKTLAASYGYSAGQIGSRRLDFGNHHIQNKDAGPFEIQSKFGRNNSNHTLTNDYSAKYQDKFKNNKQEGNKDNCQNNKAEVTDGYTEYFSQGCDYNGQLGHGQDPTQHDRNRHVNIPKSLSFDILIKQVSCGAHHTLILSKIGELFSIGSNEYGQLGLNDRQLTFTTAPLLIQEIQSKGLVVNQMVSGQCHSMILTDNGQIYSWGSNIYGQCGLSQQQQSHLESQKYDYKSGLDQNSPRFVQDLTDLNRIYSPRRIPLSQRISSHDLKSIAAGENFSGLLTNEGDVYTFGDNSEGQLGVGTTQTSFDEPVRVKCEHKISQLSLGYKHMLLLTFSGRVLAVGRNKENQLGLGASMSHQQNISIPMRIEAIKDVEVIKVVAGGFSAAIIQNAYNKQLLVWGQGDFGIFDKPQKLYMDDIDFNDIDISKFSTNSPFAVAIEKSGKVYSWGSNTLGQLGHGDQRVRKLPTQIQSLKRKTITQLSIGHNFVVMLGRDVSQEEQARKKLKRKMQKEAKEKEKMLKKQGKQAIAQDENQRPKDLQILTTKDRYSELDRRESNQPATPKLPGESGRESLGVKSIDDNQYKIRPKSASNHIVKSIIDEMEKISSKGQGLLDRCKNLKEAQQIELKSSRSPYAQVNENIYMPELEKGDLSGIQQRQLHSTQYGPTKSASFGENELLTIQNKDTLKQAEFSKGQYMQKYQDQKSETRSQNENTQDKNLRQPLSAHDNVGYQQFNRESIENQRYREEIEDLKRQLKQTQDNQKYQNEIYDLKQELQRVNMDCQRLRDDQSKIQQERDQEIQAKNTQSNEQNRQIQDYQDKIFQKDREISDLRNEVSEIRNQHLDSKKAMIDQDRKLSQLEQEKIDLGKELDEAAMKNQQLMTIVKQKSIELHETQKIADQAKTMKKQIIKLEEIIDDLQKKNKEINDLLNRKMIERAETYKKQVVEFLNKPKTFDNDNLNELTKPHSNQYKKLGEELNKDQMTYIKPDQTDQNRMSYNDQNYRDYKLDNNFASEYGKSLVVNNSVNIPDKSTRAEYFSKQLSNSEKKNTNNMNQNPDTLEGEKRQVENYERNIDQTEVNKLQQKTRSLPRQSKYNRNQGASPFFEGDQQNDNLMDCDQTKLENNEYIPQSHSAVAADKREDVISSYQRNRFAPLGQSVDGIVRQRVSDIDFQKEDFQSRTRYQGSKQSYDDQAEFHSAHFNDDKRKPLYENQRPNQALKTDGLIADEVHKPRIVSSTYPARSRELTGERDESRSRVEPDINIGRPPLTGQRVNDKERELSIEMKHSRVRSGHNIQNIQGTQKQENNRNTSTSQIFNDSHNLSRRGNDEIACNRSSQYRSNSERRYSGDQTLNVNQKHANQSNQEGSTVHSRDGLSVRSRDQNRAYRVGGATNENFAQINTAQSKTRKEYVDITDCSDQSDRNRKVHRIDLAQEDQDDIQKQIQAKLSRIQMIFKGQQQRQMDNGVDQQQTQSSGAGNFRASKYNEDSAASINERASYQPISKDRTQVETNSFNGKPTNGSKTPHSNHQQSSLPDLHDREGSYHRMSSNPGGGANFLEEQTQLSKDYNSGNNNKQQRRQSFSHYPSGLARDADMQLISRDYELNRGSYNNASDLNDQMYGNQQQLGNNFSRPGEMRYQHDQQDFRD